VRIALVSQEYPPESAHGGIGSQTSTKARVMAALGHEVHVISCGGEADRELRVVDRDGVTVHRLPTPERETLIETEVAWWVGYSWAVSRYLNDLEQRARFDVIDFAEYGAEGWAYLLNRSAWTRTPVAIQLHGPLAMFTERIGWPEPSSDLAQVGAAMEDAAIVRADALMACSENIRDFVVARNGIPAEEIEVVYCGIDAELFSPAGSAPDPLAPKVLFVGNVSENKGVDVALDAVLELRPRHPGLRLQVVGKGDDDLAQRLLARADAHGTPDALELVGFVGERARMPDFYRRTTVFCSPAEHEPGVANVFLEAMACGCPAVASTAGGGTEAVIEGVTGELVPPGDVAATAAALESIVGDPDRRARMSAAARAHAVERFGAEGYVARVLSVYDRAIERAGAAAATDLAMGLTT
jgi:glycosyltransferase involved in cell wall biosynthesis